MSPSSNVKDYEQLKRVAERWITEIWQLHNLDAFDELHNHEFHDESPAGRGSDRASYRAGMEELFAAFPDFHTLIDDLVVDITSKKVAIRWHAQGTHEESFMGIAPTHRDITFSGIEIIRVEGDKITERWGEWDSLDLLGQLRQ
jgi:steroid delta-isomerase-like uncharacterized protein